MKIKQTDSDLSLKHENLAAQNKPAIWYVQYMLEKMI